MRPWPGVYLLTRGLLNFSVQAIPSVLSLSVPQGSSWTTGTTTVQQVTGPTPATYTYAWQVISGGGLTINSPTSQTTSFSGSSGGSWTVACTVTNNFGQVAVTTVNVGVATVAPGLSVGVSINTSTDGQSVSTNQPSGTTVTVGLHCHVQNGVPPYSFHWSAASGPPAFINGSSTTQNTVGTVTGQSAPTTIVVWWNCTVVDATGASAGAQDNLNITWWTNNYATTSYGP